MFHGDRPILEKCDKRLEELRSLEKETCDKGEGDIALLGEQLIRNLEESTSSTKKWLRKLTSQVCNSVDGG